MCFNLPILTFTQWRGILEPRGNLMAGMSCSTVVMRANDRWGIGDKDCGGSERAAHAASTAEQIPRKKVEGICKGNAAKVDSASLLGSITTLHSDASTEGISSKRLPKRRKNPSHCFGTAIKNVHTKRWWKCLPDLS